MLIPQNLLIPQLLCWDSCQPFPLHGDLYTQPFFVDVMPDIWLRVLALCPIFSLFGGTVVNIFRCFSHFKLRFLCNFFPWCQGFLFAHSSWYWCVTFYFWFVISCLVSGNRLGFNVFHFIVRQIAIRSFVKLGEHSFGYWWWTWNNSIWQPKQWNCIMVLLECPPYDQPIGVRFPPMKIISIHWHNFEFMSFSARCLLENCLQCDLDITFENFLITVTSIWTAKCLSNMNDSTIRN